MQRLSLFLFVIITVFVGNGCQDSASSIKKEWVPNILKEFREKGSASDLPDFSYAGYGYGEKAIPEVKGPVFKVTDFGAISNDSIDDTRAIQAAVETAGRNGGGVVLFPVGRFLVNMDSTSLDIIRINYDNIVMRGAGSGKDGTIIFSGSATTQPENQSPWLSPFVFHTGLNIHDTHRFYSVDEEPVYAKLTKDLHKGDDVVNLKRTDGLKAGDVLILAMRNTTDEGDLIHYLMSPLEFEPFQTTYLNAGKRRDPSFQWAVEVKQVLDDHQVKLCQPARRDILKRFKAFAAQSKMLHQIGVEHFRFESAWKGGYKHHLNREADYGWGAVCLHRVSHGWIRDIHVHNYTQTTHLVNSRNVTIDNVVITGLEGHYGPKMYHSSDNLVTNIRVEAKRTHGPGLEGLCFGNVYKDITLKHAAPLDMHGISGDGFCPPMFNLYENISLAKGVAGGGAPQNIPHAGDFNTFWNIEMTGIDHGGNRELFHSWIWRDPKKFHNEMHEDCHKQYLRSIVVGVRNPKDQTLTIEKKTDNRADHWIYVEGLNRKEKPVSLYETQLKWRLK